MNYRKLERITLWSLTIIMLIIFLFNSHSMNTVMNLNTDLINLVDSSREIHYEVVEDYRQQINSLQVENAKLRAQIEIMEEDNE